MFCARFLCSCLRGVCCPCFLPPIDHSELGQKLNYFLGICGSKQTLPFVDTGTSISDVSKVYSTAITVVYCMYVHVRTTCMYTCICQTKRYICTTTQHPHYSPPIVGRCLRCCLGVSLHSFFPPPQFVQCFFRHVKVLQQYARRSIDQ